MNSDASPIAPPVKLGDIVWAYDILDDMKVPLVVVKLFEDGTWNGSIAWTWAWA